MRKRQRKKLWKQVDALLESLGPLAVLTVAASAVAAVVSESLAAEMRVFCESVAAKAAFDRKFANQPPP